MANANTPIGFVPLRHLTGGVIRAQEYPIANSYAANLASGDFFEISSISSTGFTVHFKNSSNASVDRNFTYQAVGFGKGG